jgi:ATP-dependent helicase/nuclease subunit A
MPRFRPYEAIAALAGAGKTYLLTTRFIGLMSLGVAPERIVAITFTRKAAAEIFDRVVRRLAAASVSEGDRRELLEALREFRADPSYELPAGAPLSWLRLLLDAMPRVRIGTIDSFFLAITQTFALELGLPLRVELMDDNALEAARAGAVERTLAEAREDAGAQESFLEEFKRATAGEDRRVVDVLRSMVDAAHDIYLDVPDSEAWGGRARIWRSEPWWLDRTGMPDKLDECLRRFEEEYVSALPEGKYRDGWSRIVAAVTSNAFDEVVSETIFKRLPDAREALRRGSADIRFDRRDYSLAGPSAQAALAILAATTAALLRNLMNETQGLFRLVDLYERAYGESVRGRGRLAFSDVPFVLRRAAREGRAIDIGYRLDATFDHWMLDEFQDTSSIQWEVLGALADEVLQSSEASRGFFYVGDVKQAIYGWRGGEATLFDQVRNSYRMKFGEPAVLAHSWRSSPVVLDAVNRVFGRLTSVEDVPESAAAEWAAASRRWEACWTEHRAVPKHANLPGRVELHVVAGAGSAEPDDEPDPPVVEQTVRIVRNLADRKVRSIAVLVRLNSFGNTIADALKRRGLDARREINPALLDNGTVSSLLSLFHLADHPADTFAWRHVEQTPLGPVVRALAESSPADSNDKARRRVAAFVRDTVARKGAAGALKDILDRCRNDGDENDPFIAMRLRQLIETAMEFDKTHGAGPAEFAEHAATLMVTDPGVAAGITVMTVHKAKGLEFDAVVLPDLQDKKRGFTELTAGDLTAGGSAESPWVLPMPRQDVAPLDPVISGIRSKAMEQRIYDELCLLYVAMTRARQGLYMVTRQVKSDNTLYAAAILQQTLGSGSGTACETGDPAWMDAPAARKPAAASIPAGVFRPAQGRHAATVRRLMYRTPSGQEDRASPRMAETLFAPGAGRAARRGSALHDLFQRIGWIEEDDPARLAEEWLSSEPDLPAETRREVLDAFNRAVADPGIRAALSRPAGRAELWREQAFELSLDGVWISGRFDRAVMARDPAGRVTSASVLDFKSDRVSADEVPARTACYQPQVASYRTALARLTGLPESAIGARLLFTHPRIVVEAGRRERSGATTGMDEDGLLIAGAR